MSSVPLANHCFVPGLRTYAVLDAARSPGLSQRLSTSQLAWRSLYSGVAAVTLREHAPYLLALKKGEPLTTWFLEEEWGKALGIIVQSESDLETVRLTMKKKLFVREAQGTRLYFRFYDPRVLRSFLATGTSEHLAWLLEPPVRSVLFETREGDLMRCAVLQKSGLAGFVERSAGALEVGITRINLRRPTQASPPSL